LSAARRRRRIPAIGLAAQPASKNPSRDGEASSGAAPWVFRARAVASPSSAANFHWPLRIGQQFINPNGGK
jgi:hypothetical protein